jgi:hypothetical protein
MRFAISMRFAIGPDSTSPIRSLLTRLTPSAGSSVGCRCRRTEEPYRVFEHTPGLAYHLPNNSHQGENNEYVPWHHLDLGGDARPRQRVTIRRAKRCRRLRTRLRPALRMTYWCTTFRRRRRRLMRPWRAPWPASLTARARRMGSMSGRPSRRNGWHCAPGTDWKHRSLTLQDTARGYGSRYPRIRPRLRTHHRRRLGYG